MKKERRPKYKTHMFGFPLIILDAPMKKTAAGWVLDIPPNILEGLMMKALAHKTVPLSGSEIRFIRHNLGMTLSEFGDRFDVSHAAVIGWEKCGSEPTTMKWPTEKDIRLLILDRMPGGAKEIFKTYRELQSKPRPSIKPIPLKIDWNSRHSRTTAAI